MLGAISIKKENKIYQGMLQKMLLSNHKECDRECMRSPILCKRSSLQDRVNALLMRFVSFQDKRKTPYYRPPTEWRRLCFQSYLSISPFVRVKGGGSIYMAPDPDPSSGPVCTGHRRPHLDMFKLVQYWTGTVRKRAVGIWLKCLLVLYPISFNQFIKIHSIKPVRLQGLRPWN